MARHHVDVQLYVRDSLMVCVDRVHHLVEHKQRRVDRVGLLHSLVRVASLSVVLTSRQIDQMELGLHTAALSVRRGSNR